MAKRKANRVLQPGDVLTPEEVRALSKRLKTGIAGASVDCESWERIDYHVDENGVRFVGGGSAAIFEQATDTIRRIDELRHLDDEATAKNVRGSAGNARGKRTEGTEVRKAWVRCEYDNALTARPKDRARARRLVKRAFAIKFPGESIELDTIKKYVSKPRSKPAK